MTVDGITHIALAVGPVAAKSIFDSIVGALASPTEMESRGEHVSESYRFWFKFLNRLAMNFDRAKLGNGNGVKP